MDVRRDYKNTMENINPTDTTDTTVVAGTETAPAPDAAKADESASTSQENLTALIEVEKQRGKPDPKKALERFKQKHLPKSEDDEEDGDDENRPVTKRELAEFLAEQQHRTVLESQQDTLINISEEISSTADEAELIRSIHANRIFPIGMSIREQMQEAKAIANVKRVEAQNAEMARKIASQQNASRNTATTHRDPQTPQEPELAPDLKQSMMRSGFVYNTTSRRYEKTLPNGKILVKETGRPPYLAN